ncbi:VOC family protein [Streptomyces sp. NPDC057654]|uniref:VOC family protein n=1 Tax=Streptomyces sp. NPDC057654 TaxID=3346196 RepID=UPI0036CC4C4D
MTEEATRRTPGTPCWTSLMVHSLAATQEFYSGLFGWTYHSGPGQLGPYVRAELDGRPVAGIGELPPGRQLPVSWTTYLASDDADATAERIRCCGGTVGVGPLEAEEEGRLVIAMDPSGATFGVWEGRRHLGAQGAGVPGTPVWHELLTAETTMIAKFYESVFGYETEAVVAADFDYLTLNVNGAPAAAIHGVGNALPRDQGPRWMTYFETADTDAAAGLVAELGGQVLAPPRDAAPGRLATVADPEGAVFSLLRSDTPAPQAG